MIGGILVFILIVLVALHLLCSKRHKLRWAICIVISLAFCLTKTLHGMLIAVGLIAGEIIVYNARKYLDL